MALHQQLPFFNPSVPFSTPIQGGLMDGMIITLSGRVLPDAEEFSVNLHNGSNIALDLKARYECSLNIEHDTSQKWGSEQKRFETPFSRGQLFVLQILVTLGSYKVSINEKPFMDYKHRLPFKSVDSFHVDGKVALNLVAFQLAPHLVAPPGSFKVPYKSIIHGGLHAGKVIIVQGFIQSQPYRIVISLRHKHGIALDYSPRFDENVVVRNTYEDGQWGEEERSKPMPFKKGEPLLVVIFCGQHQYEVFVNGEKAHTYSHRFTNLEEIDVLDIRGDVQLTFVQP
ncbi:galectin-9-like [Ctenopharyngodon idella]|uniref:galectin-9-like n=1 Tax=Ctenopharyngodon idella TaxID=7959 RepID=UPI0022322122|nr:galectin-9-like [Ctenopharyngodon idella]